MRKFLKSKLLAATLLSALLEIVGGLLVMAPFLIFFRIHLEHSGSAFKLWPVISPDVIGDLLINDLQALIIYLLAATVIYIAYFPLKTLLTAGIYAMIMSKTSPDPEIRSMSDYLSQAVCIWPGFIKAALFGVPVYIVSLFVGIIFGGILGHIGSFLRPAVILIFLLMGSTYLQILKIRMITSGNPSLRNSIKETRSHIASAPGRIILGNISVTAAGLAAAFVLWLILKWVRDFDWNLLSASCSLVLQQAIVFVVCLAQVLRINYNHSILKKGE